MQKNNDYSESRRVRQFDLRVILSLCVLSLLPRTRLLAQSSTKWDQQKAVKMVTEMLATEANGAAWDENIDWLTDVQTATRKSRNESKPLFVYWYVKKMDNNKEQEQTEVKSRPVDTGAHIEGKKLDKC